MPDIQTNDVLLAIEDRLATITLNRPERRNAVSLGMCQGLYRALTSAGESAARVILLRGAGTDFCVGADLHGEGGTAPRDRSPAEIVEIYHAATLLHTLPQITIAAIDGGCAGAGMGWAMACDLRFASDRARFATAFLNVGAPGDMGLAWSLTQLLGGAKARELLLLPEKIDAVGALEAGLVSRVWSADRFHDEAMAIARSLAARDFALLSAMKANLIAAESLPIDAYIDGETRRHLAVTGAPDFAERMTAAWRNRDRPA